MELNTVLDCMAEFNLSADEILFIYLCLCGSYDENHPELITKWYIDCNGQDRIKQIVESLKEKSIILKTYNPETVDINNIPFNKNFIKRYYKCSGELGQELFEAYERYAYINGKYFSLRNFSKRFSSFQELFFFYSSQIQHNPSKHKEILEIVQWAKENNLLKFGIVEFIVSHKWNELKELRESGSHQDIASTFDIYDDN